MPGKTILVSPEAADASLKLPKKATAGWLFLCLVAVVGVTCSPV
jgi:hypothetical protein